MGKILSIQFFKKGTDMKKQDIIDAIVDRVKKSQKVDYSIWRIGLTHDTDSRKEEHQSKGLNTKYWKYWEADSLSDAENIESYFINKKGMKGGTGGNLKERKKVYVYIF